jgi:acyl-CoA thioesterase FadM
MNLWLRLLLTVVAALRGKRIAPLSEASRVGFRVLPSDLDLALHMNNGRYLNIMDLGRVDLMIRAGLLGAIRSRRWLPVLSGAQVHFRRELRLWQQYVLETKIVTWDGTWFTMEQRFLVTDPGGRESVAALAVLRGGFFEAAARRRVPVEEVLALTGVEGQPPLAPQHAVLSTNADISLRHACRN